MYIDMIFILKKNREKEKSQSALPGLGVVPGPPLPLELVQSCLPPLERVLEGGLDRLPRGGHRQAQGLGVYYMGGGKDLFIRMYMLVN